MIGKGEKMEQINKNKKVWAFRILLLILILLWMRVIFGFSAQTSEESSSVSQRIVRMLTSDENKIQTLEHIVRKLAHFSIYTVGGILIFGFCETFSGLTKTRKVQLTLLVGVLYAISDELHQKFVSGRSCQITDVLIDSCGVIFGMLLVLLVVEMLKKRVLVKAK